MRRMLALALVSLASQAVGAASLPPRSGVSSERYLRVKIPVPIFGEVDVFHPEPVGKTRGVVLFVSGDGGWNRGVVDMARRLADRAVVVGLSMPAWQRIAERAPGRCWYPAGDLETIAQVVEKRLAFPRYVRPILVGYSSGATLAYGALAQAPPTTFVGAVSLGFCPDLEVARPFCGRPEWKPSYDPKKRRTLLGIQPEMPAADGGGPRWTALQGDIDQVCEPGATARFVSQIPAAKIVSLHKVGHGFSVPRNWGAAFDAAVDELLEARSPWDPIPEASRPAPPERAAREIGERLAALGLPLEVSWPEGAETVVVFLSGDGGWAEIDQEVAKRLAAAGVAVVGWNSLKYFWEAKIPGRVGADLAHLVDALPPEVRVFVGGYSFGAEVVPVVLAASANAHASFLPRISGMILLAPGRYASFEVSPLDWLRDGSKATDHPVPQAIASIPTLPVLCLEPKESDGSGCPASELPGLRRVSLPGGHHFGGDFRGIVESVLAFCGAGANRHASADLVPGMPKAR